MKKNVKVASDNPLNYPFTDWSKGANLAPPSQKKNIFIFKYPLAFSPRAATDILTKATAIRVTLLLTEKWTIQTFHHLKTFHHWR